MKKKLASELYSMNYELATYSCADQLVESPALTFIVGVAKRAQFRAAARTALCMVVMLCCYARPSGFTT